MEEKVDDGGLSVFMNTGEEVNRDREVYQEKIDDPNRGAILPFRKTEEGVKFAAPKWWLEMKQAVTLPRDTIKGYQPTGKDAANFALNVGVGGITTSSATKTPEGAILGAFFNKGQKTHRTPMYRTFEQVITEDFPDWRLEGGSIKSKFDGAEITTLDKLRGDYFSWTTFRSPLEKAFKEMDFPEKGLTGRDIKDSLSKLPNVRGDEIKNAMPNLDPKKRYTAEEAFDVFRNNDSFGSAMAFPEKQFTAYQRQNIPDKELDYIELPINSGNKNFTANGQHYNDHTLAHSRLSLREDSATKKPYVLVEEMQSDLVQKGAANTDPERVADDAFWEFRRPIIASTYGDELFLRLGGMFPEGKTAHNNEDLYTLANIAFTHLHGDKVKGLGVVEDLKVPNWKISKIVGEDKSYDEGVKLLQDFVDSNKELFGRSLEVADEVFSKAKSQRPPPISTNTEAVRLNLQSAIAYAQKNGADEVVIPPLKDIVDVREFENEAVKAAMYEKGSAFHNTYVQSVNKVLKRMKQELGDKIQVREKPYMGGKKYDSSILAPVYSVWDASRDPDLLVSKLSGLGFPEDLLGYKPKRIAVAFSNYVLGAEDLIDPKVAKAFDSLFTEIDSTGRMATVIDISGMKDLDLTRPRFNKGGLVTRRIKK